MANGRRVRGRSFREEGESRGVIGCEALVCYLVDVWQSSSGGGGGSGKGGRTRGNEEKKKRKKRRTRRRRRPKETGMR